MKTEYVNKIVFDATFAIDRASEEYKIVLVELLLNIYLRDGRHFRVVYNEEEIRTEMHLEIEDKITDLVFHDWNVKTEINSMLRYCVDEDCDGPRDIKRKVLDLFCMKIGNNTNLRHCGSIMGE